MNAPPKQQSRNSAIFSGPAPVHEAVHPAGLDAGRHQPVDPRVGRREVELAVVVLQAVAREVDEEQVVPAAIGEEALERASAARRAAHSARAGRRTRRSPRCESTVWSASASSPGPTERREARVLVLARGDDEGAALLGHQVMPGSGASAWRAIQSRITRRWSRSDSPPSSSVSPPIDSFAVRFGDRAAHARTTSTDLAEHRGRLADAHDQRPERGEVEAAGAFRDRDRRGLRLDVRHVELEQLALNRLGELFELQRRDVLVDL